MAIIYGLKLLPICSAVLSFLLVQALYGEYHPRQKLLAAYQELSGLLREKQQNSCWYQKKEKWFVQNGGAFHYGRKMTVDKFLAVKFILAALGMMVLAPLSWEYGLTAFVFLFCLPSWLLLYLNAKDNERMLPELKLVYHALEIQIRAGVYMMDSLAECYGSVQEKRLRSALLELAGDIVMKADVYEALDKFQSKFDNRYVDSLCITILQALESGQAVELLWNRRCWKEKRALWREALLFISWELWQWYWELPCMHAYHICLGRPQDFEGGRVIKEGSSLLGMNHTYFAAGP